MSMATKKISNLPYHKDEGFRKWLETEIHPIYKGKKKIVNYKPPLEPAYVFALATKPLQRIYKQEYLAWKKHNPMAGTYDALRK